MGIFNKMFGNSKGTHAEIMLLSCLKVNILMLEEHQRTRGAIFEVLLFSSLHILRVYRQKQPALYSRFEADYFEAVYNYAQKEGIINQLPCEFPEFVNNRFKLYDQQLNSLYDNPQRTFIPTKIVYNFYENPLTRNGGNSSDLEAALILIAKMKYLFETLNGCIELIIKGIENEKDINIPTKALDTNTGKSFLNPIIQDSGFATDDDSMNLDLDVEKHFAYWESGDEKVRIKDYLGAIADYTKAIEFDPANINLIIYTSRAAAKREIKDYAGAIYDYSIAIMENPFDDKSYYYRAASKIELKDYIGAISDFNHVIEISPKNALAIGQRGYAKSLLKDYLEAIDDFSKAIEINPRKIINYFNRGSAKDAIKDYSGSISDYSKVLELDPVNTKTFYYRGNVKFKLHDFTGAIIDLNKAIEIFPNYPRAYYTRGEAKAKLKDYSGAINDFSKYIEFFPEDSKGYYLRGCSKYFMKNPQGAITDLNKAIEINAKLPYAYYFRGHSKIHIGLKESGYSDLIKAGRLGYAKAYEDLNKYCPGSI